MAEKKILIIDYDKKSLDYLAKLFVPYEFQILKAMDGQSGFDKFKEESPDLVILEAMLPKLHGFDLVKKISQESKGKVPVIIVTGLYKGEQVKREALCYFGATDYFEKPVDETRFLKSALSLLNVNAGLKNELPDSDSILQNISKKIKNRNKVRQEVNTETEEQKEKFSYEEFEWDTSVEKALTGIDDSVIGKITSRIKKDKKEESKSSQKK